MPEALPTGANKVCREGLAGLLQWQSPLSKQNFTRKATTILKPKAEHLVAMGVQVVLGVGGAGSKEVGSKWRWSTKDV